MTSRVARALLFGCGVLVALGFAACHRGPTGVQCDGPFPLGGDVKGPERLFAPAPEYTEEARRLRIQGVVILNVTITCRGTVEGITVVRGLPAGLTEAAVQAVSRWRFAPATLYGRPVSVFSGLTVNFRLQ